MYCIYDFCKRRNRLQKEVQMTLKNTTGSIEGRPTLAELSRTRLAYKREVKRSLHVPIAVI